MAAHIEPVSQTYAIDRWGEGYFGINRAGHVSVCPDPDRMDELDLYEIAHALRESGLQWPVLVRFTDILHHRIRSLCQAFSCAAEALGYRGGYCAVYPIKVNQQHSVVHELVTGGGDCAGLEAGSKPELMAVLAESPPGGVIVCNGYKDAEYVRLALIAKRLGHQVYLVIEKPSELDLVLAESKALDIEPLLGVRVRLAAVASGNWQNSGGEKSKFGLSALQVLALVERLRGEDRLHWLQLLHSHIGSQIPNLRDIRKGLGEAARYFVELRRLGVPVGVVDVGGGLGIDYEGTASRHYCSTNYNLAAYAREVVKALAHACDEEGLDHPMIFSESGRALTAHHAVLISNVIDREAQPKADPLPDGTPDRPEVLQWLQQELAAAGERSPEEAFQEARNLFEESRDLFRQGELDLAQRAQAEALFYRIVETLRGRLAPSSCRHRELQEQLNELLAERVFLNFSLFQSLPDVWAIDQVFPVMPLQRLDEPPALSAVVHDLTCDSDGSIGHYVDQDGVESTLPLHPPRPGEDYLLGIFLVGAYQEILGDMHNLFGDTDAVNVSLDSAGGYRLSEPDHGDRVDELLSYVHFDPAQMLASYREKLDAAGLEPARRERFLAALEAGLHGYTYFED